MLGGYFFYF